MVVFEFCACCDLPFHLGLSKPAFLRGTRAHQSCFNTLGRFTHWDARSGRSVFGRPHLLSHVAAVPVRVAPRAQEAKFLKSGRVTSLEAKHCQLAFRAHGAQCNV